MSPNDTSPSSHDTESLQDVMSDFGATELQNAVEEKYSHLVQNEVLFGEPLDVKYIKRAVRTYDHGQASEKTVTEWGVQVKFDPDTVSLATLQEDGEIREELTTLADTHFDNGVDYIDVAVTDDEYDVWIVAGHNTQPITN